MDEVDGELSIDCAFAQFEDTTLAAMAARCNARVAPLFSAATHPPLVIFGAVAEHIQEQLKLELENQGITVTGWLHSSQLPEMGEDTYVVGVSAYLLRTAEALKRCRGCTLISAPFPIGPDGTRAWIEAICQALGVTPKNLIEQEEKAWGDVADLLKVLNHKTVFFLGETLQEISLARCLARAGMGIHEICSPHSENEYQAAELALLRSTCHSMGVQVPKVTDDISGQYLRLVRSQPDLVITGLAQQRMLKAEGFTTKWSAEFNFRDIHGFSQFRDFLEQVAAPLRDCPKSIPPGARPSA